jgi:hypothetical protein
MVKSLIVRLLFFVLILLQSRLLYGRHVKRFEDEHLGSHPRSLGATVPLSPALRYGSIGSMHEGLEFSQPVGKDLVGLFRIINVIRNANRSE